MKRPPIDPGRFPTNSREAAIKSYQELRSESRRNLPTWIVDFDGTLSKIGNRKPFDWDRVGEDEPILPVVFMVQHLQLFSAIVITSGRSEEARRQSEAWLSCHGIFSYELLMRSQGDYRPDEVIKEEIFLRDIQPRYSHILGAIDDRPRVVKLWQKLGIFTLDVNNGRGDF